MKLMKFDEVKFKIELINAILREEKQFYPDLLRDYSHREFGSS
jgi:hypothetical protein